MFNKQLGTLCYALLYLGFFGHATMRRIYQSNGNDRIKYIIGGSNGNITNYPYLVSIREHGKHFCGGAIISSRHVVTAAHCVNDAVAPFENFTVVTGTSFLEKGGEIHKVKNISSNPHLVMFHHLGINDVAVITLADSIELNDVQNKIKLPTRDFIFGTRRGKIMGWGYTHFKGNTTTTTEVVKTDRFKVANVEVLNYRQCNNEWKDDVARDVNVCSMKGPGVGTCNLDSGGPLVVSKTLIGIVSWGEPCAIGKPDVFTNVYQYLDFIKEAQNGD